MPQEKNVNRSKEIKELLAGIKEALVPLRGLLVAIIAIAITFADELYKIISQWRKNNKTPTLNLRSTKIDKSEVFVSKTNPYQIPKKRTSKKTAKLSINSFIYPTLATISTITLIGGVGKLNTISNWADVQIECIEKAPGINGRENASITNKVMTCNGGHN